MQATIQSKKSLAEEGLSEQLQLIASVDSILEIHRKDGDALLVRQYERQRKELVDYLIRYLRETFNLHFQPAEIA